MFTMNKHEIYVFTLTSNSEKLLNRYCEEI